MDPDSVFLARLRPGSVSAPRHGELLLICSAEMATMRLHPLFYRSTLHPIGRSTSERPRPLSSYSPPGLSLKVTTPADAEASLTIFWANLFASLRCPSRKWGKAIGPACSVLQKCACDWLLDAILHKTRAHRNHPPPHRITLRQRVQSDGAGWSARV